MFLLVLWKSNFFTRAALVSFVQHSCRTRVVLVALVSYSCCTCVACVSLLLLVSHSCRNHVACVTRVWHSCCKLDQICVDLILTNHPKCFQNPGVYETGISDFHKLTFTALKTYFQKAKPRIIKYRDYNHFDNNDFRDELIRELSSNNMQSDDLARFANISKMILEKNVPSKKSMSDITKLSL